MTFIEDDDVIETFAADRADDASRHRHSAMAIAGSDDLSMAIARRDRGRSAMKVSVSQQKASACPREGLGDLAR